MKKTYLKVIAREVKGSLGRFAAIFGIVMLGVSILSGLLVTTPDMFLTVDKYYDDNNMTDVFIKGTMGLTDKDMEKISKLEGIKEIMPAYSTDTLMEMGENDVVAARLYGLPLINDKADIKINKLTLIDGRFPTNINECLVERGGSFISDIEIGTKLVISDENEDSDELEDIYKVREFTVVGIVSNPFYFSREREKTNIGNGRIGAIVYVDESSYALDFYTDFYITVDGTLELNTFHEEYEKKIEAVTDILKDLGKERSLVRYEEVLEEAYDKLAEGKKEYEDAKQEAETKLADALKELQDGRVELSDALVKLIDGEKELKEAKETLEKEVRDAQIEIEDARIELADALIELEDGEKELADAWIELQDGQKKYVEGYTEYLDAKKELEDAQRKFDDGEEEYLDGIKKLEDAKRDIKKGERELSKARQQLEEGEEEYYAGIKELNYQKAQFEAFMDDYAHALQFSSTDELFYAYEKNENVKFSLDVALNNTIDEIEREIEKLESSKLELETNIRLIEMQLESIKDDPEQAQQIIILEGQLRELNSFLSQVNSGLQTAYSGLASIPKDGAAAYGGWKQIKNAEYQLQEAREKIEDGWAQYDYGRRELSDGKREIEKGERELEKAKRELDENREKLEDGWRELEDARIELEDAKKKLEDGYEEYYDGRRKLDDGWIEYQDGLKELADAEATLQEEIEKANKEIKDAEIELADGRREYEEGLIELSDGEREYYEAKLEAEQELNDAAEKLKEAEDDIKDLEVPEWYVLDRNHNVSYVSYILNAEKVEAISKVFPIFFYLVAALVALTTMTRMVEEERTQIGTLKALGYSKSLIMIKYIVYSGASSFLGAVTGLVIGFKLLPIVIYNAYSVLYHLPDFIADFNIKIGLISSGLAILSTMAATIYACYYALKEKPSTLMLPRAPKAGKRILLEHIGFIWSRMSFNQKATARNIFRYKKHFFMTVIGIAGCTALLVTGFGLRDSLGNVANKQYSEIFNYDLSIEIEKDHDIEKLEKMLNDDSRINNFLEVYQDKAYTSQNKNRMEAAIFIPENLEHINNFIDFRDRKTGNKLVFNKDSIIITEKIAETLELNIGDKFTIENSDGRFADFTVTDITENYLGNYIYMDKNQYLKAYKSEIDTITILADTIEMESTAQDELISDILLSDGVLSADFMNQARTTFDNLLNSINYIVIVIILASGALAFIVLYNLTNININERRKELATLKVLGFHNEEVSAYIFRETTILCFIGILVGLFLGRLLHTFIITTVESPEFMFIRDIKTFSYIISSIITVVFSLIVNIFMYKKLRNIEMVDSMKAID